MVQYIVRVLTKLCCNMSAVGTIRLVKPGESISKISFDDLRKFLIPFMYAKDGTGFQHNAAILSYGNLIGGQGFFEKIYY